MGFQSFKGICVGGIADGREYTHDKPEMVVDARTKLPDGTYQATGQRTEYRYLLLLGSLCADIGVWVPVGIEVDAVILRLLKFYKPHNGFGPMIREG